MHKEIKLLTQKLEQLKPLVVNVTNYVTMDFVANGLLSVGASPVMTHAEEEIVDFVQLANVVVINLGTLDNRFLKLCHLACEIANQLKKPIILDPVGAGASVYRTQSAQQLLAKHDIAIIRGNASELMALAKAQVVTKGVDSTVTTDTAISYAQQLSNQHKVAIVMSGACDVIIDQQDYVSLNCGSPLMPLITGSGCLLTSVVAAFHAIEPNRFHASRCATYFYGLAGEVAANKAAGPGSFKQYFLDTLHNKKFIE